MATFGASPSFFVCRGLMRRRRESATMPQTDKVQTRKPEPHLCERRGSPRRPLPLGGGDGEVRLGKRAVQQREGCALQKPERRAAGLLLDVRRRGACDRRKAGHGRGRTQSLLVAATRCAGWTPQRNKREEAVPEPHTPMLAVSTSSTRSAHAPSTARVLAALKAARAFADSCCRWLRSEDPLVALPGVVPGVVALGLEGGVGTAAAGAGGAAAARAAATEARGGVAGRLPCAPPVGGVAGVAKLALGVPPVALPGVP